ncbi:MAG: hypothetical protein LUD72_09760 [Bacteroidales bacterium]|nr:hypothetical protein [Bacteroidales bacterium]
MSKANPESAIDAFIGKAYTWKGYTFHASMRLFVALEASGVTTDALTKSPMTATLVGIYSLVQPQQKVMFGMQSGTLVADAIAFGDQCTPVELDEAQKIVADAIDRYFNTIATYTHRGKEGNDQAVAGS